MGVEIVFPVEFLVSGTPPSHQSARRDALDDWKANVREASRSALPEGHFATDAPVAVTVYYFTDGSETGDLDNIIKPILDAVGSIPAIQSGRSSGKRPSAARSPRMSPWRIPTVTNCGSCRLFRRLLRKEGLPLVT